MKIKCDQKTVPSEMIFIGGPLLSGLSSAAISRPNFQVPASKTFGNVFSLILSLN